MKRWLLGICLSCMMLGAAHAASELKPYTGGATPPLRLKGLDNKLHDLKDYRGKVVLVNFWATWCPPCRHEMPSMQRLKQKMAGKPFVILAVDMAEPPASVSAYIKQVKTDFPVLLDRDGSALKAWRVFAFPTSFVVGPDGSIKYALFGAKEWDDKPTVDLMRKLGQGVR